MMRWGDVFMRAAGAGKQRSMAWTESGDVGLKYLSCKRATLSRFDLPGKRSFSQSNPPADYTDNGAYYYYNTSTEAVVWRRPVEMTSFMNRWIEGYDPKKNVK